MNLVNDYLVNVSSAECLVCGVESEKIRLATGQQFAETEYCYGDILINDIDIWNKIKKDTHYKEYLENRLCETLLNGFSSAMVEITAGYDTGCVNIGWGVEP